jgi:RNA polymerase sigma-70 factor (ECF subfamily)
MPDMYDGELPFSMAAFILTRVSTKDIKPTPASKRTKAINTRPAQPSTVEAGMHADDDLTLRQLIADVAGGNQGALGHSYDATISRVYAVALRIVRRPDLAEEVVSDVYLQVWRDSSRYDDSRGRALGWLLVIARSRALDLLRRQDEAFCHPDPHDLAEVPMTARENPHDLLAASQSSHALHDGLLKLTPLQRQLLSLAFFRGYSHSEIVEHTGIPLGSVKTHIRRSLAILRESLGPEFDPLG